MALTDLPDAPPAEPSTSRVPRAQTIALAVVLAIYLGLGLRMLTLLPLWGPVLDEPIYFGYAKYVAVTGTLPRIQPTPPGTPLTEVCCSV